MGCGSSVEPREKYKERPSSRETLASSAHAWREHGSSRAPCNVSTCDPCPQERGEKSQGSEVRSDETLSEDNGVECAANGFMLATPSSISVAVCSFDSRYLVCGSDENDELLFYQLPVAQPLDVHVPVVDHLAFSQTSNLLLGAKEKSLALYQIEHRAPSATRVSNAANFESQAEVNCITLGGDRMAVAGCVNGWCEVFSLTGEAIFGGFLHNSPVVSMAVVPRASSVLDQSTDVAGTSLEEAFGYIIASVADDSVSVLLWDPFNGALQWEIPGDSGPQKILSHPWKTTLVVVGSRSFSVHDTRSSAAFASHRVMDNNIFSVVSWQSRAFRRFVLAVFVAGSNVISIVDSGNMNEIMNLVVDGDGIAIFAVESSDSLLVLRPGVLSCVAFFPPSLV